MTASIRINSERRSMVWFLDSPVFLRAYPKADGTLSQAERVVKLRASEISSRIREEHVSTTSLVHFADREIIESRLGHQELSAVSGETSSRWRISTSNLSHVSVGSGVNRWVFG